ncbi:MAG: O-acetylhomoserine aminocarboxypropyltransferase/cysteine synthase family protein [Ruminococcus sp.]
MKFNTALLHNNSKEKNPSGATLMPIYQVSAFSHESAEQLEKVFNNKANGFAYTRISNPTTDSFEKRMALIEKGIGAVSCSSGMAAVSMALLNILESGDEIIAGAGLFGGTIDLFSDLEAFGIKTKFVNHITAETTEPLINERTKVVFGEIIGNPALDVVDIAAVTDMLHKHNIPFFADCTTATPYLLNAFDFGADVVIHSSSKYINGGGNSISGIIIDSGRFKWDFERYHGLAEYKRFGKFAFLAKLRNGIWRNMGACLSPMNAFMNNVGLETLGLRMERLCDNALKLAEFLENDGRVSVNYPALKSNPYYPVVQKQFGGKGGAILTIRTGSKERAFSLINNLKYALNATNIGDVRTLVIHPASTIYTHSTEEQKLNAGVFDDTIRVSIGIEDIDDLIEDFRQAIDNIK